MNHTTQGELGISANGVAGQTGGIPSCHSTSLEIIRSICLVRYSFILCGNDEKVFVCWPLETSTLFYRRIVGDKWIRHLKIKNLHAVLSSMSVSSTFVPTHAHCFDI